MHVALRIRDILDAVFEHLNPSLHHHEGCASGPDAQALQVLHDAALVCRAFSEPALKQLWTHVSKFDALLGLLPSSAKLLQDTIITDANDIFWVEGRPCCKPKFIWIMEGPITEADRARFIFYTQHIRILHMRATWPINSCVFEHLSHTHLGFPPLPRLHTLYSSWWGVPHQSEVVALLSGPALRRLSIRFPAPESMPAAAYGTLACQYRPIVRALLADVAASATALESLTVYNVPHPSLLEPIGALRGLLRLDLSHIRHTYNLDFLKALETLDQLDELLLGDHCIAFDTSPCTGFRRLQKLTIRRGMSTVPDLLAVLPNVRLKAFCVMEAVANLGQIQALADALCAGPGLYLDELALLDFKGEEVLMQGPVSVLLTPLFALQGIRRFDLGAWRPVRVEDEDLQKLGRAWPKLERIHISGGCSDTTYLQENVGASMIEGIVELANTCPRLNDVKFTTVIPAMASGNVGPSVNLETDTMQFDVRISDERIRDVGQVTRVLHAAVGRLLVPGLDRERYRRWSAVLDGITKLSQG